MEKAVDNIPLHFLIVDWIYSCVGGLGRMIGSIELIDIEIRHIDKRLRRLESHGPGSHC